MSETITPADIAAAADFADQHEGFKTQEEVYQLANAFARHRASERQAIVDWLRAEHHRIRAFQSAMGNCEDLAGAIERGEHLEAPSPCE